MATSRFEISKELENLLEDNIIIPDELEVDLMKDLEIKRILKGLSSSVLAVQFSSVLAVQNR